MKRRPITRHVTATLTVEREVSVPYGTGLERDEIELTLTGIAHPGCEESPPTWDCGGEPAEPPSVEDVVARTSDGKVFELTDEELAEAEEALLLQEPEEDDGE